MILHRHNLRFFPQNSVPSGKGLFRGAFLIAFFLLPSFFFLLSAQGGSVRIAVYGGGSVDFIFNSIKDYNTGVTYNNWTLLGLEVIDAAALPDYKKWKLTVNLEDPDGDGSITGLNGNLLPFSTIEVKATISVGCPSCQVYGSPFIALSAVPTMVVDGGPAVGPPLVPSLGTAADQVNISYRCGVTTSLLGKAADFYSDNIIYTLEMDP